MTGPLRNLGTVHMIGIGGAGMSVVAELLAAEGVPVQGSEAQGRDTLDALRALGVRIWVGHDAGHVVDADTVVVSSAIRDSNPELAAARAAGLPVLHRSQALALLMDDRHAVAVAGAHGKTTTSAMIATVLREAGRDPSFAIGSSVLTDAGPIPGGHRGSGDVLVAEADESDGSFLNYTPSIAVVTNVEPDHLDHYGSREAFEQAFVDFADRIEPGGLLVACADDRGAMALAAGRRARGGHVQTYGVGPGADLAITAFAPTAGGAVARFSGVGDPQKVTLRVPGEHNVANAAAAYLTALALGVDPEAAARGLGAFRGTGRRFEERGTARGVRVVDDYAHHPTEVAALLDAAREMAGGRVLILFQPHLYSRTRVFAEQFAAALDRADIAVVTDVYAAREDPDPQVDATTITRHMAHGTAVPDRLDAARAIARCARPGDLVLTVGAGDVTELGPVILDLIEGR